MSKYLESVEGDKSSKRLWGSILLANGILLKNLEWALPIFKELSNLALMQTTSESLIYAGAALLGIGVIERFSNNNKKK